MREVVSYFTIAVGGMLTVLFFLVRSSAQGGTTATSARQNEGLVNALSKMKSKGRISVTGTLGYVHSCSTQEL